MRLGHLTVVLNFNFVTSAFGPWERDLYKCLLLSLSLSLIIIIISMIINQRHADIRLTLVFKIIRGLISVNTKELLRPVQQTTRNAHPESFIPLQTLLVPSASTSFREQ